MALLAKARGSRVRTKTYPPERDISDEPPRIGVFVCHCGSNIASVVDVERVVERTRHLPGVVLAETNVYTCADDNQDRMKAKIAEHRLNRVVVASCTPRTHEPIFRDTLRDAGLNPVPAGDGQHPRPMLLGPLGQPGRGDREGDRPGPHGGGPGGRPRALAGGNRAGEQRGPGGRRRHRRHDGRPGPGRPGLPRPPGRKERPPGRHEPARSTARWTARTFRALLAETIERTKTHPRITVHLQSRVAKVGGHVGEFTSPDRQRTGDRRDPSRRGRRGHRRHGAEARHVPATARASAC